MAVTKMVSSSKNPFISRKTRWGLMGTSSKFVLRSRVERSSSTRSTHSPGARSGDMPRAVSAMAARASFASETIARSGGKTRPIWRGSMSTWTNFLSPRYTSRSPVCRSAKRLPIPITRSLSRNSALA